MNCTQFRRWYPCLEWLPQGARSHLSHRLDAHRAACPQCQAFAEVREALPGLLQQGYAEQVRSYATPAPLPRRPRMVAPLRFGYRWALAGVVLALASAAGVGLSTHHVATNRLGKAHPVDPRTSPKQPVAPGDSHPRFAVQNHEVQPRLERQPRVALNTAPGHRVSHPAAPAPHALSVHRETPTPDEQFLDGRDPALAASWTGQREDQEEVLRVLRAKLPPMKDDFVRVALPRLAAADGKGAGEAIRQYEEEAKTVDARLFHKVTLACKAVALEELCQKLTEQTGVKIQASRGIRDEKVTVFVEDRPARDVMREVARLFNFMFSRVGEPNAYKYTLEQDLRSQLAEEELRSRDVHQALLALDEEIGWFRQYADQNIDGLLARVERNKDGKDEVASRLYRYVKGGGWGPAQLYFRLSPAERDELFAGKELRFTLDDPNPERRLPKEWRDTLLKTSGLRLYPSGVIIELIRPDTPSTPIDQVADAQPQVTLSLNRSEAGEVALWVGTHVTRNTQQGPSYGGGSWELGKGRSASANPENAKFNAALRNLPVLQSKISLLPAPSCPRLAEDEARQKSGEVRTQLIMEPELREPHLKSADVWEEIHRRTQLPVVADAYTHLYPASRFHLKAATTFDVLCQAGDQLGARWRKDGDFLLGRSTSFFWDKLKEVPNRLLRGWQADQERNGGLPLEDLLQMANLSDQQLGSTTVGLGITHCWQLDEWGIIGGGPFIAGEFLSEESRKRARTLSLLTPAQLAQARKREGLSPRDILPQQAQAVEEKLSWDVRAQDPWRFHVEYVPHGHYVWEPWVTEQRYQAEAKRWPHISAATKEAALAEARKWDPQAVASDIHRTRGRLDLIFIKSDGEWIGQGGPRVEAALQ